MRFVVLIIGVMIVLSCNNSSSSGSSEREHNASIPKTLSDTLYKEVMEGHDIGMAKMGEIARYQKLVEQKRDSLQTINSKKDLQILLDSVLWDLSAAEEWMSRWMQDFEPDKAGSTETEKISFYRNEKEKIDTVNALIFRSIERAKVVNN